MASIVAMQSLVYLETLSIALGTSTHRINVNTKTMMTMDLVTMKAIF